MSRSLITPGSGKTAAYCINGTSSYRYTPRMLDQLHSTLTVNTCPYHKKDGNEKKETFLFQHWALPPGYETPTTQNKSSITEW